jgi:hypothetical protein
MAKLRGPLIGLLALVVVGATLAVATNPTRSGRITACVDKQSKEMRLAGGNNRCKEGERRLRWNQRGAQGEPGARGERGPSGADGQPGAVGADASATTRGAAPGETLTFETSESTTDGPEVTVQIPGGGANVILGANWESRHDNTGNGSCVALYEGGTRLGGLGCVESLSFVRQHATLTIAADEGSHTYTLRYQSPDGGPAYFRDRTLIASVLR